MKIDGINSMIEFYTNKTHVSKCLDPLVHLAPATCRAWKNIIPANRPDA